MLKRHTRRPTSRLRLEALDAREVPALLVAVNQMELQLYPNGPPPMGPDDYMPHVVQIQRYGTDSYGDAGYVSIYGMRPPEWFARGIRLLGG